jgi:hypothetical protein
MFIADPGKTPLSPNEVSWCVQNTKHLGKFFRKSSDHCLHKEIQIAKETYQFTAFRLTPLFQNHVQFNAHNLISLEAYITWNDFK